MQNLLQLGKKVFYSYTTHLISLHFFLKRLAFVWSLQSIQLSVHKNSNSSFLHLHFISFIISFIIASATGVHRFENKHLWLPSASALESDLLVQAISLPEHQSGCIEAMENISSVKSKPVKRVSTDFLLRPFLLNSPKTRKLEVYLFSCLRII